ncbi:polysaccharide export protein [Caminibacter mediatlanticus TB-2]|uniref:Polysaccharide export protein n=1 Tax=Caminibacter mediatlanticus TB-2 TaxID=391592 RepID=A0ABX5VBA5_9BACT|nr:SLBB domain-containing protein [Caminibacter mediatlanticus]QCT94702.1 polysaccharide export protein [Caminibacter mediatlanticus TB-2]
MRKIFFILLSVIYILAVDITITQTPNSEQNSSLLKLTEKPFGYNLFLGKFSKIKQFIYNPHYRINIGDEIVVMFWGAFDAEYKLKVDNQGNIFIPKVGVIHVMGLEAGKLNIVIKNAVRKVFKNNVFVYANVLNYQPINVFVTGAVNSPGLYQGLSTDSIIQFIDKAKGINLNDGSFRKIYVKRNNKIVAKYDLYDFLTGGNLKLFQFKNGDIIFVDNLSYFVNVTGDVKRPYRFELLTPTITLNLLKVYALPKKSVSLVIVNRFSKGKLITKRFSINDNPIIYSGDNVEFISDFNTKEIKIYIDGEINGKHTLIVRKGTSLKDVLNTIHYTKEANIQAIQLYRKSIAKLQKQLIDAELKDLEAKVLTTSSVTTAGATIKKEEAQLILDFIKRAKKIQPKGKVILNKETNLSSIILEDGDTIFIPKKSSVVTIQGEVKIPGAQTYVKNYNIEDYIKSVGGFTNRADKSHILIVRQSGKVITYNSNVFFKKNIKIKPGDSILVLSKPSSENLQITKDITQILYQIAVSAGIVLRLF